MGVILRRIGLLGGTFDPPHRGHLTLAHHFAKTLQLDEIVWIPTGHSWQKVQTSASTHRLAMTRLIAEELQQQLLATLKHAVKVSVSEIEIQRAGPSYTLDTLRVLRSQYGEDCILCWLMGLDQLLHLTTWNTWQQLFNYSHVCVANRPGYAFDPSRDLNNFLKVHLGQASLVQSSTHGVLLFDTELNVEISSTQLRKQLEEYSHDLTSELSAWLTPAVIRYIEQHQLYFNN